MYKRATNEFNKTNLKYYSKTSQNGNNIDKINILTIYYLGNKKRKDTEIGGKKRH